MPLLYNLQRDAEWHRLHQGRVTASIAAGCLGLCPYISRQKAYRTITGRQKEAASNRNFSWGAEFEPVARRAYEVETGNLVEETGFWIHKDHNWLGSSPDGLVGADGLLEIKCLKELPKRIPVMYRIQMIVQIEVCERKWCDFFCWCHNGTFLQRVYPSGALGLIRRLAAFREAYVLTDTEPPRKTPKKKGKKC